jgi:hypothetical protein
MIEIISAFHTVCKRVEVLVALVFGNHRLILLTIPHLETINRRWQGRRPYCLLERICQAIRANHNPSIPPLVADSLSVQVPHMAVQ